MSSAEIYTKPSCPYCVKAKDLLRRNSIQYQEFIIGQNGITKETVEVKIGDGRTIRTVPQIFVDNNYIGGYTELCQFFAESKKD